MCYVAGHTFLSSSFFAHIIKTVSGCLLDSQDGCVFDFTKKAIKDQPYFTDVADGRRIRRHITKAYGSEDWKKDFGHDMAEARKEKAKAIAAAQEAVEEEQCDALVVGVHTPTKRARKKAPRGC